MSPASSRPEPRPSHETVWACAVVGGIPLELVKIEEGEGPCYLIRGYPASGGRGRWAASWSAGHIVKVWERHCGDPYPAYELSKGRLV